MEIKERNVYHNVLNSYKSFLNFLKTFLTINFKISFAQNFIQQKKISYLCEKSSYQIVSKSVLKHTKIILKYFHIKFCPMIFH